MSADPQLDEIVAFLKAHPNPLGPIIAIGIEQWPLKSKEDQVFERKMIEKNWADFHAQING